MPVVLEPWGTFGEWCRQHGRAGGRWQENRALRRLQFAYADRAAPLALARSLASELQRVPVRDVLRALHGVPQARPCGAAGPGPACLVAWMPALSARFPSGVPQARPCGAAEPGPAMPGGLDACAVCAGLRSALALHV